MKIPHRHVNDSPSTNSELLQAIIDSFANDLSHDNENPHFSHAYQLTADRQSNGRGQHGRSWQSPIGNVYLSLYLPNQQYANPISPNLQKTLDGRLSLCVGYQLATMPIIQQINQQLSNKIGVKWVNDIGFYQNDIFQKLSGILIEPVNYQGKMLGVVVGVGFNVCHAPILTAKTQEGLAYQAISLADFDNNLKHIHDLSEFYQAIQTAILQAIVQFNELNDSKKLNQFLQDFANVDVLNQQSLIITSDISQQSPIIGIGNGMDNNGCLQILQHNGEQISIFSGNIRLKR